MIEHTTGMKVQNFMFDKFWYNFREKITTLIGKSMGFSPTIYQNLIQSHLDLQRAARIDRNGSLNDSMMFRGTKRRADSIQAVEMLTLN